MPLFTHVPRRGIPRTSPVQKSKKFVGGKLAPANAPLAGPTRRPGDCGTRLPAASCAADRRPGPAHRCARAFRAAPPCGRGTPPLPGTYPPGRAGASSRNPQSFASSSWPIAGIIVPRLGNLTSWVGSAAFEYCRRFPYFLIILIGRGLPHGSYWPIGPRLCHVARTSSVRFSANFALKLSEKGYEHCSNGEFEGVGGAKIRRKALSLVVQGLRRGRLRPFSDSFLDRKSTRLNSSHANISYAV